jgi:anthranilate/para-aminobenzoate synthase component II
VHGRTSPVHHDAINLFAGIPSPMTGCRYHSLVVDPTALPAGLAVTARDDEGTIMAIEHAADHLYGVQFHPESILTEHGFRLLANFLDIAGIPRKARIPEVETQPNPQPTDTQPDRIVTF